MGIFSLNLLQEWNDCPLRDYLLLPSLVDELFARTGSFLEEIVYPLLNQGKNVLIVGHGAMNLSIISRIRGLPRKDFWSPGLENCRLIRLI